MKLAVIGLAVRTRPRVERYVVSAQQLAMLALLKDNPGLGVNQVEELITYAARTNIDRALQGLIKKGYLRWELNPITNGFRYYITREGKQWLTPG